MAYSGIPGQPPGRGATDDGGAQHSNFEAARALADVVRTTLGPKGLDKMLVGTDGTVVVTNHGASILNRLEVNHPAVGLVVEVAERQDSRVGDGTTTAIVLTGELLGNAESLLARNVHPTTITRGYYLAASYASTFLDELAVPLDVDDDEQLRNVARTVVTGKWNDRSTDFLAELAVETVRAIERDGRVGFERITRKTIPGSSFYDSEVIEGLLIDMEESSTDVVSPDDRALRRVSEATVALVDGEMSIDVPSGIGTVGLKSFEDYERFTEYERNVYETYVDRIIGVGADAVFCQQSIDDAVRYLLADEGVLAVERTRRDEFDKLARATGAHPVDITELTTATVGRAKEVKQRDLGTTTMTVVSGLEGFGQVSLLARGGTEHVAEETKRMLDICFHALKLVIEEGTVLPGGGAVEVALASELREYATEHPGKEQLAIEQFADALEHIPRTLAETAGLHPIDVLVELREAHNGGANTTGLDVLSGEVRDIAAAGVLEPLPVKRRALASAAEAANVMVRVDDTIPVRHEADDHEGDDDHDHGSGSLVRSTDGYPWALGHSMGHSDH